MLQDLMGSGAGLFVLALAFVLAVLWCFLPFAVFSIKSRIERLLAETQAANALHQAILDELRAGRAPRDPAP